MTPRGGTHPYVYRVYDADGLIYVGATRRLWYRLREHQRYSWWAPTVTKVVAKVCPTIEAAKRRETEAILRESPRWNQLERQRRLRSLTEEEFLLYATSWARATTHHHDWREFPASGLPPIGADHLRALRRQFRRRFGKALVIDSNPPTARSESAA